MIRMGCRAGAVNGVWEWEMTMEAKNLGQMRAQGSDARTLKRVEWKMKPCLRKV